MIFSRPYFLQVFLPLLLALYYVTPGLVLRNLLLLIASWVFYSEGALIWAFLLPLSTAVNYIVGKILGRTDGGLKRLALSCGLLFNLSLLCYFKYAHFLLEILGETPRSTRTLIPIGISFYTFQAMGYLLDVYRGSIKAEKNFLNLALYISFFPQLLAGPILRYREVSRYLAQRSHTLFGFTWGIRRFSVGLAKKVVLADTLALLTEQIFSLPPEQLYSSTAWLGAGCFVLQIYFDFSGYSDMAIGLGAMFGFKFRENFNYPLASRSMSEFWTRWHVTLTNWFRDYLYSPIAKNASTFWRGVTLLWVFALVGLWHGPSWNFVLFGLLNGLLVLLENRWLARRLVKSWKPLRHGYTILGFTLSAVFFRTDSLQAALATIKTMFMGPQSNGILYTPGLFLDTEMVGVIVLSLIACTPLAANVAKRLGLSKGECTAKVRCAEFLFYLLVLWVSALKIASSTYRPFLYFEF